MRSLRSYWLDLKAKMVKDPLPPEDVAAGWALGMFIGCSVPFGLQLIVSIPLALMMRVSKVGATVGTLITNPVSILFIYPAQCWVGSRILGKDVSWPAINKALACVLREQEWSALAKLSGHLVTSFFAGGFLFAAIMTPITYYTVLNMVKGYRIVHERVRRKKKSSRE